jgi:hypothetical protein
VDAVDTFGGSSGGASLPPPMLTYSAGLAGGAGGAGAAAAEVPMRNTSDYLRWLQSVNATSEAGWAAFTQSLASLRLSLAARSYNPSGAALSSAPCVAWDVAIHFDLSARGVARVRLEDR